MSLKFWLWALDYIFLLQDRNTFTSAFKTIGKPRGLTGIRVIHYPAVTKEFQLKPDQVRCGAHTDYGAITLLFQDEIGGLEVRLIKIFLALCFRCEPPSKCFFL